VFLLEPGTNGTEFTGVILAEGISKKRSCSRSGACGSWLWFSPEPERNGSRVERMRPPAPDPAVYFIAQSYVADRREA